MTTTSPWAPQTGPAQQIPADPAPRQLPAPPRGGPPPPANPPPANQPAPPRGGRSNRAIWLAAVGVVILMIVAIAATAAITYAIARGNISAEQPAAPQPTTGASSAPQFTAAEQSAADGRLCGTFDTATKGQQSQGGLVQAGALNMPLALRTVSGAVAVQNALVPAVSPDLAKAARNFVDRSLDSVTAALASVPADEGNRLNDLSNSAIFALADSCGLPR